MSRRRLSSRVFLGINEKITSPFLYVVKLYFSNIVDRWSNNVLIVVSCLWLDSRLKFKLSMIRNWFYTQLIWAEINYITAITYRRPKNFVTSCLRGFFHIRNMSDFISKFILNVGLRKLNMKHNILELYTRIRYSYYNFVLYIGNFKKIYELSFNHCY